MEVKHGRKQHNRPRIISRVFGVMAVIILMAGLPMTAAAQEKTDERPDYTVYVNRTSNVVTVKEVALDGTEKTVRTMLCSTGRTGHKTPRGTYYTSDSYDWRIMVDGTWGRYAVRINNKVMFHSVPYLSDSPDTLEWEEYNKLGEPASLGCVRLAVADAKWIYDNCKKGTKVIIFDDTDNPDPNPLGKPVGIKLSESDSKKCWDPTDPDVNNPWKKVGGTQ